MRFLAQLANFQKLTVSKSMKCSLLIAVILVAGVQIGCVTGNALRTAEKTRCGERTIAVRLKPIKMLWTLNRGTPEALSSTTRHRRTA